jgi:chromatin segregation and condensation protein Rec8/ScpA/Scc1 (kleisin family)
MKRTKFFTIVEDDPEGERVTVEPSEYLRRLQRHKAIARLKAHIESLQDELRQYSREDLDIPEKFVKARKLAFELEIVREYLAHLKQAHETIS